MVIQSQALPKREEEKTPNCLNGSHEDFTNGNGERQLALPQLMSYILGERLETRCSNRRHICPTEERKMQSIWQMLQYFQPCMPMETVLKWRFLKWQTKVRLISCHGLQTVMCLNFDYAPSRDHFDFKYVLSYCTL